MNREKIIQRAKSTAAECRKRDRQQKTLPNSLQSTIYKDCNSAIMSLLGLLGVAPTSDATNEDRI